MSELHIGLQKLSGGVRPSMSSPRVSQAMSSRPRHFEGSSGSLKLISGGSPRGQARMHALTSPSKTHRAPAPQSRSVAHSGEQYPDGGPPTNRGKRSRERMQRELGSQSLLSSHGAPIVPPRCPEPVVAVVDAAVVPR